MENKIVLVDENGREESFNVVLTFSHPENNKQYVIFEKEDDSDDTVFAYRYDEENNLYPIEDDQERQMIEEVLYAFNEDENET